MRKEFHIEGPCFSSLHYMADISNKISEILELVDKGKYFIINRPRQYGKTTTLNFITKHVQQKGDYVILPISFEGIGEADFQDEAIFCKEFLNLLGDKIFFFREELHELVLNLATTVTRLSDLSRMLTKLLRSIGKKVILLIDEVDRHSNNQLFLDFLGMLRNKYIQSHAGWDITFHSVILAGVHDIRTLKQKLRPEEQQHLNSSWNIAAEFTVNMSLQVTEIIPMLDDYKKETGIQFNHEVIAQKLFDYTSGYPFLVSKICKVIDEYLLPKKKEKIWETTDIELAINKIIAEENFNFDSLIKNIENNPALYDVVQWILLESKFLTFNVYNPILKLGLTYGVFKNNGRVQIHNKVYEQIIYNYMISKIETSSDMNLYNHASQFILGDRSLDMKAILLKFQAFMKEQYSDKDQKFVEREGRLIFLSFLKPIINGHGYTFKEAQISTEKRLDIVITFYQRKYIVELKLWYGQKAHQDGIEQLSDYLDRQHQTTGYLVIFEHRRKKTWQYKPIKARGKDIFAVWV